MLGHVPERLLPVCGRGEIRHANCKRLLPRMTHKSVPHGIGVLTNVKRYPLRNDKRDHVWRQNKRPVVGVRLVNGAEERVEVSSG
jgi:hypothetical protein